MPTIDDYTKVGFFAWKVWWGKILTTDQLSKRGFPLASRCPFCSKAEEVEDGPPVSPLGYLEREEQNRFCRQASFLG